MGTMEMTKPTPTHRQQIELALCRRDYELLGTHHNDILDVIEGAVTDGVTPELIKRWATGTVGEPSLVQRVYNAARYCEKVADE